MVNRTEPGISSPSFLVEVVCRQNYGNRKNNLPVLLVLNLIRKSWREYKKPIPIDFGGIMISDKYEGTGNYLATFF